MFFGKKGPLYAGLVRASLQMDHRRFESAVTEPLNGDRYLFFFAILRFAVFFLAIFLLTVAFFFAVLRFTVFFFATFLLVTAFFFAVFRFVVALFFAIVTSRVTISCPLPSIYNLLQNASDF